MQPAFAAAVTPRAATTVATKTKSFFMRPPSSGRAPCRACGAAAPAPLPRPAPERRRGRAQASSSGPPFGLTHRIHRRPALGSLVRRFGQAQRVVLVEVALEPQQQLAAVPEQHRPREVRALVGDQPVLVAEHDEVVRAVDEEARLAVHLDLTDDRAALPDLLEEAVVDRPPCLGEHEPRFVRIPVDERDEPVGPDEDRVRLLVQVEQLEARAAFSRLATDPLAEVEPLRLDVRQRLDELDGGTADVEELEEGAAG